MPCGSTAFSWPRQCLHPCVPTAANGPLSKTHTRLRSCRHTQLGHRRASSSSSSSPAPQYSTLRCSTACSVGSHPPSPRSACTTASANPPQRKVRCLQPQRRLKHKAKAVETHKAEAVETQGESGGNKRQNQCLSHECGGNTQGKSSVFKASVYRSPLLPTLRR